MIARRVARDLAATALREVAGRASAGLRNRPAPRGLAAAHAADQRERAAVVAAARARQAAHRREVRRVRRTATLSSVGAVATGVVAAGADGLVVPVLAIGAGWLAVRGGIAWRAMRRLPPLPGDPVLPAELPPPPPESSAAAPLLARVEASGDALRHLLAPLVSGPPGAGDLDAPVAAADAALAAVARARADLWLQAARVAGVEDALRRTADPRARAELERAWVVLLDGLAAGADAHERLVATAAELLAAQTVGTAGAALALERVQEAADSLAGLAHGLRTLAAPPA